MTAVVWGDPLACHYSWIEPRRLAELADDVHHVGRKVEGVAEALEAIAALPEVVFAGAAAESLRVHAGRRWHETTGLRASLRALGRALHEHAGVLQRYRDGLAGLRRLATTRGLEVRDHHVWAPPGAPPEGSTPQQYDAWVTAWKSYRSCFDLKTDIEQERHERSLDLARAVTACTGARPESGGGRGEADGRGVVGFGLRGGDDAALRRAAERGRRAIEDHEALESARARVAQLRDDHRTAMEELHRLARAGAAEDELTAQAREVRIAAGALRAARAAATSLQAEVAERIS